MANTASISRAFVISKCGYFVDVQLWPIKRRLNPEKWLSNFSGSDLEHAVHLLNGFVYFSEELIGQIFFSGIQNLSRQFAVVYPHDQAKREWELFVDSTIITRVEGETPSDTDSSFIFTRMARQRLGFSESQILSPADALEAIASGHGNNVIFVDDFVGSGNQMWETWNREYSVASKLMSFRLFASLLSRKVRFFYCPIMCSQYGLDRLQSACSELKIVPAHVIPHRYSALHSESVIWPAHMAASGPEFIEQCSHRAGIPVSGWKGFHDLGLAIAFSHGVPDATLPIFYWPKNGWHPLVERL